MQPIKVSLLGTEKGEGRREGRSGQGHMEKTQHNLQDEVKCSARPACLVRSGCGNKTQQTG